MLSPFEMIEPRDIVDIPIEDETEHSQLPSVEEARMHAQNVSATHNARDGRHRKRRIMLASILVGFALLGLIIGLAVGLGGRNGGNSTASPPNVKKKPAQGQPNPQPTQQPVSAPTDPSFSERAEEIISFLFENEISEWGSVRTTGTPQNRAVLFLADQDAMVMEIPEPDTLPENSFEFLERYAVSVFYYSLGVANLASSGSTCEWFRTFHNVGGHSTNIGVVCNGQGQVHHIFTPNLNLQGSLPMELGLLTKLATLVIPDNRNVFGTIPHSLHKLTELTLLDLASNNLSGMIPSWIGALTELEYLALSDNDLTGTLPTSMGNLTSLALLALDGNDLSGNIHLLESLKRLRYLYLEHNKFEQTLRNTTLKDLTRLVHMDLSDNKFHGDTGVPRHFFEMPNLEVLDLTDNNIKGKLPENIPRNEDLRFLFLHGNSLSGSIPTSIQNLFSLNHLDLSQNKFTGSLPHGLGDLSSLVYMFLSINDFEGGPIPDFLEKLTNLRDLSLKDTQRTGTIPTWIDALSNLILLDLDGNALTGPVPPELGDLKDLSFLLLNRNELTGTLPEKLASLKDLSK